jgi:hypothetical protein
MPSLKPVIFAAIMVAGWLASAPSMAAHVCPANGKTYKVRGVVKSVNTTHDGQAYYNVVAAHCGSSEDDTIAVYPATPVTSCVAGKQATARGRYDFKCVDQGDLLGGVCIASLSNANLSCR